MSTLKVNTITNDDLPVDFPSDIIIGSGNLKREAYSQATEPSNVSNGAVWYDTTNSLLKLRVEGAWYTVNLAIQGTDVLFGDIGIFAGGMLSAGGSTGTNVIQYISIPTPGNAQDFGDLLVNARTPGAASDGTRGLFAAGNSDFSYVGDISIIIFSTTGNATDFGNLTSNYGGATGVSDSKYAVFGGMSSDGYYSVSNMDYVTIQTGGDASNFGNMFLDLIQTAGISNLTYGIFAGGVPDGGENPGNNTIQYITIATPSNALDFGDLLGEVINPAGCGDLTRGIIGGGFNSNVMQYITIDTPGNSTDFGDLTVSRRSLSATSNGSRGVFSSGRTSFDITNVIDYITISTPGNATDFGDLLANIQKNVGTSGN